MVLGSRKVLSCTFQAYLNNLKLKDQFGNNERGCSKRFGETAANLFIITATLCVGAPFLLSINYATFVTLSAYRIHLKLFKSRFKQ